MTTITTYDDDVSGNNKRNINIRIIISHLTEYLVLMIINDDDDSDNGHNNVLLEATATRCGGTQH